jgi:antitoxin component of MazEF toxin-antitoxin module
MPLLKKLSKHGGSKSITIPNDWLEYHEKKLGQEITTVLVDVGEKLTISVDKAAGKTESDEE